MNCGVGKYTEIYSFGIFRTYKLPMLCILPFPKRNDPSNTQEFPPGKHVLAVYPGTTALYKATVVSTPRKVSFFVTTICIYLYNLSFCLKTTNLELLNMDVNSSNIRGSLTSKFVNLLCLLYTENGVFSSISYNKTICLIRYLLEFDDDEEDGALPQRTVPFHKVVALPEGHRQ